MQGGGQVAEAGPVALGPEGRYRLVRRIASGGMGEVWEADDTVLGRRVALKVLVEELAADDRATRRFVREARATARLTHPNVARVYDFGRGGKAPFLVMELLEGETLAARLAGGPLPPTEAARIAASVADALDAAHQRGIVHRDVKPANVMLTPGGGVKVMDFGIAAAADETHSTTGSGLYATVSYVSPERVAGEPATPASDVYSLGAVLYELLSGRPPFSASTPALVARAHLHDQPAPVRQLAPWVPARLAEAAEAALAKDPARRPSSAAAFAARLRAAAGLPAEPPPRSGSEPPEPRPEPEPDPGPEPTRAMPAREVAPALAPTVRVDATGPVWRRHRRRFPVLLAVLLVALLAVAGARELAGREQPADGRGQAAGGRGQAAGGAREGTGGRPAAAGVTVTLRATAEVWARATVDGKVAYEGTLAAGEGRAFTARRVVELRLGNAGGAQLTVDGRPMGAPGRPGQVWQGRFTPGPGPDR
jgi:eukaryotic-like serine/threonine-protein kinase